MKFAKLVNHLVLILILAVSVWAIPRSPPRPPPEPKKCGGVPGMAYSEETQQCYHLFRQEYCGQGEWIEKTKEGLKCTPNTCIQSGISPSCVVKFNGSCVKLHGLCHMADGGTGKVEFDRCNKLKCLGDSEIEEERGKSIPRLRCAPGYAWSDITDSCRKTTRFDFGR